MLKNIDSSPFKVNKLIGVLTLALAGCGGGGGGGGDSTSPTPITKQNNAPIFTSKNFSLNEDEPFKGTLSASDADGDKLTYSLISPPASGELSLDSQGAFTYQPEQDFFGEASFSVEVSDGKKNANAEFTLTILPINDKPTVSVTSYSVDEDNELVAKLEATDVDGDPLTFIQSSAATSGSITLSEDGQLIYQPHLNYFGADKFMFKVSDGELESDEAEVTLTINPINDAPTLAAISSITRLDKPITFALPGQDVDGDLLTYKLLKKPQLGNLTIHADHTATYTPNAGVEGEDSFTLSVADGELSATAENSIDNNLSFKGEINLATNDMSEVDILLTSDKLLKRITPNQEGKFKVYGLMDGQYALKARKSGFKSSLAQEIELNISDLNTAAKNSSLVSAKSANAQTNLSLTPPQAQSFDFELEQIDSAYFSYHWQEDQSTAGTDYAAYVNEPVEVTFLNESVEVVDDSSANHLHHDFNILLVDKSNHSTWTQEHAYRILETMKSIPQKRRDFYQEQSLPPSKWMLTSDYIEDDIQISQLDGTKQVLISEAVFVNAAARMAKVEGKRGIYYSQRLHHALVRFVTNNGHDQEAYEKILNERYGVSTLVPDYPTLTTETTGSESAGRFQKFHAEEIVQIINMFEEMPKGMHKLPELNYLVRRLDGTPHPLYASAPAVAWPWAEQGYIEFMETAFNTSSVEHMHRLIIHEKAHFLWENQFDQSLKKDWIELGGWYEDSSDPDGWATTKQTEFVSAYAHQKNPNEDMAESISYFIINPDKLKSRALGKYEFVRDRIMQSNIYLSKIRDDLTFQVYNLFPDYVFPGKIKRVDIFVDGQPEQDKEVTLEIELHALDTELEGAKDAYLRVFSEVGTYVDVGLYPIDQQDLGTVLRGQFSLSKHAKSGYWRTDQIVITDAVGNKRMEGANDFGWKLYINNPLEDLVAPEYVAESMTLSKSVTSDCNKCEGKQVQILHANWQVVEEVGMAQSSACYASMNDELPDTYRFELGGQFNQDTSECEVEIIMPDYMPSSNYSLNYLSMTDKALNMRGTYFTDPGHALREEQKVIDEAPQVIELVTTNPDTSSPTLDLNDIQISATPTNPEAPNGETEVSISFRVKDDISGYNIASLYLRDPQGITHQFWVYNDDTYSLFPQSDPTEWQTYTRNIILPVGSAPGTWGLSEMTIYDRANNFKGYDFTEIVHFEVIE